MDPFIKVFYNHALEKPDKVALCTERGTFSYLRLWRLTYCVAQRLLNSGVKKGDCIIIQAEHSERFVSAAFACHLTGAVFVPVEKSLPKDALISLQDMTGASVLIGKDLPDMPGRLLFDDFFESVRADAESSDEVLLNPFIFPAEDQVTDILFTTGTTGTSKGVMVISDNIVYDCVINMEVAGISNDSVYLASMPTNHCFCLRRIYSTLYAGGTLVLVDGIFPPGRWFKMIEEYHVDRLMLVPSAVAILLKTAKKKLVECNEQIKSIEVSSSKLNETDKKELLDIFPDTKVINCWGATEIPLSCALDMHELSDSTNCIGKPTRLVQFAFLDEAGKMIDRPTKENPGYIAVKSPMNTIGYLGHPELNETLFIDGYVRTQDIGYIGDDGYIYMLGRAGDVINVGGLKVSPHEIEDIVMSYEHLKDCAVIGIPDPVSGQKPKLFVVADDGYDEESLRTHLREKLDWYQYPRQIEIIDEIPRTYNGKIRRNVLAEKTENGGKHCQ